MGLYLLYHLRFGFNGLVAVNKAYSSLFGQRYCHFIVGYRLHYSGNKRNIHGDGGFLPFSEFDYGGFKGYVRGYAFIGAVSGNEQVLPESMGRFGIDFSHKLLLSVILSCGFQAPSEGLLHRRIRDCCRREDRRRVLSPLPLRVL